MALFLFPLTADCNSQTLRISCTILSLHKPTAWGILFPDFLAASIPDSFFHLEQFQGLADDDLKQFCSFYAPWNVEDMNFPGCPRSQCCLGSRDMFAYMAQLYYAAINFHFRQYYNMHCPAIQLYTQQKALARCCAEAICSETFGYKNTENDNEECRTVHHWDSNGSVGHQDSMGHMGHALKNLNKICHSLKRVLKRHPLRIAMTVVSIENFV